MLRPLTVTSTCSSFQSSQHADFVSLSARSSLRLSLVSTLRAFGKALACQHFSFSLCIKKLASEGASQRRAAEGRAAPQHVLHRVTACTSSAPASRRVSAHELAVAPVVKTSSTRRILPRAPPRTAYAPSTFDRLPAAERST